MLIDSNFPLQTDKSNLRRSQGRSDLIPASPDANTPGDLPAAGVSDLSAQPQLAAARQSLGADLQPIEDAAAADAVMDYARNTILGQPGTALLAQANQLPQTVLELIQ